MSELGVGVTITLTGTMLSGHELEQQQNHRKKRRRRRASRLENEIKMKISYSSRDI